MNPHRRLGLRGAAAIALSLSACAPFPVATEEQDPSDENRNPIVVTAPDAAVDAAAALELHHSEHAPAVAELARDESGDKQERDVKTVESESADSNSDAPGTSREVVERRGAEPSTPPIEEPPESAARVQQDLEALAAQSTARGMVLTPQDLSFDAGTAQIRGGVRSLQLVAGVLKNHPARRVLVEAFTDSAGSESYNMELSRRRADAVKDRLEALGIAERRVETRGYGEAYPIADNSTAAGRQQNRRIELVFSDGSGQFSPR